MSTSIVVLFFIFCKFPFGIVKLIEHYRFWLNLELGNFFFWLFLI